MTSRPPAVPWTNQNRLGQQRVTQKSASYTTPVKSYVNRISCPARQSFYKNLEQDYNKTKVTKKLFGRPPSNANPTQQEGPQKEPGRGYAPSRKTSPIWKKSTVRATPEMTEDCKIFTSEFIRHMTPDQSKMLLPKLTKRKCSVTRGQCPPKRPVTEQLSADQPHPRHHRVAKNCSAYNTNEGMSGHLKYGVFRQAHNRTKRSERMQSAYRRPVSRVPVTPEHPHMREKERERERERELTRIQPRLWRRVGEQGNQQPKDAPILVFRAIDENSHKHLHRCSVMHLDIRPRFPDVQQSCSRLTSPQNMANGNRRLIHCQSHMSPLSPNRIYSPTYRNVSSDVLSSVFDGPKPTYLLPPMPQERRGQRMSPPNFWNAAVNRLPLSRNSSNARTFSPDFEFGRRDVVSPYRFQPNREPSFTHTFSRSKGTERELIRHKTAPSKGTCINRLHSSKLSVHREQSYRSVRLKNWLSNVAGIPSEANNYKPILNHKLSKPKFHSRNTNNILAHHSTLNQNENAKRLARNAHTINAPKNHPRQKQITQTSEVIHECQIHSKRGASFIRSKSCKRISSGSNDKTSNRTFLTCTCSVSPTFETPTSARRSRSKSLSSSYRTVSPELIPPEKVPINKKGVIGFARSHITCSTKESCCQTY